jgi:hypothetical protein
MAAPFGVSHRGEGDSLRLTGQPGFRLLSIARFFFLSAAEALLFFWSWFFCFDFGDLSPIIIDMLGLIA